MKHEPKSPKKYNIEKLMVAQIPGADIDKQILKDLEESASFIDTDDSLKEFLVSTDVLTTLSEKYDAAEKHDLARIVDNLYEQVGEYAYIQISKI